MVVTPTYRQRFKDARRKRSLSQAQAAVRAGISVSVWRAVEAGEKSIAGQGKLPYRTSADTLVKMAHAVGLPPREILADAGFDPNDVELSVESIEDSDTHIGVVIIGKTNDEVIAKIRKLLDEL